MLSNPFQESTTDRGLLQKTKWRRYCQKRRFWSIFVKIINFMQITYWQYLIFRFVWSKYYGWRWLRESIFHIDQVFYIILINSLNFSTSTWIKFLFRSIESALIMSTIQSLDRVGGFVYCISFTWQISITAFSGD